MNMGTIIAITVVIFVITLISTFLSAKKQAGQAAPNAMPSAPAKAHFPAQGVHALVHEKYTSRTPTANAAYWVVFCDDAENWWNVQVPEWAYSALEEGMYDLLFLTATGDSFLRFGQIAAQGAPEEEACPQDAAAEEDEQAATNPHFLTKQDIDAQERFWFGELLPAQALALEASTLNLQEFDPVQLLAESALPKFLKTDDHMHELTEDLFNALLEELAGFDDLPRKAELTDEVTYRRNLFSLTLSLTQNALPLQSNITGELRINMQDS